ncbi:WD40/YVTN/BNR-like repeat-containing protein, partial [Bacteroidota bacterium]
MKKFIKITVLLLIINSTFIIQNSFSQSGWIQITDSIPELEIMSMQFTSENTGYAIGSYNTTYPGGFLRTTNAGVNWQFYHFPNYSADDICFLNDNTGYISSWSAQTLNSYVLKTTNSGLNWFCTDSILYASFFKMKFYDINTGFVASKYSSVHKTTDGGYNWFAQTGVLWMEPSCIWCFDVDNWLVASSEIRLNKTTNGGVNWLVLDFSSIDFRCQSLYFINATTGFGSTWDGKIFKTTNKGDNWTQISSTGFSSFGNIFFVNENTGYVCFYSSNGNIYKTTNGGYNWTPQTTNPFIGINYLFFINPNTGYAGGQFGIIFKTTNGGVFVNQISSKIPNSFILHQNYPNPFNNQ